MKMKMKSISAFGMLLILSGCAHGTMRGSVAMKVNDQEGHVCLGENEVKAGDKVAFFVNECRSRGGRENATDVCRKVKVGEGEVEKILNEHYSTVRAAKGVPLKEGMVVEKL